MAAKGEINPDKVASMSLVMTAFSLAAVSGITATLTRGLLVLATLLALTSAPGDVLSGLPMPSAI
jgi:hypothetical protein